MSKLSALSAAISSARDSGNKAMGAFVTAGHPDIDSTPPILDALVRGGADFIELGMPFSDPLAEGIPIQRSSEIALRNGIDLDGIFRIVADFRSRHVTPVVLMGYYNPILQYGVGNFCEQARSSGVSGLIIPDLPPEESSDLADNAARCNLDLTFLIAPNSTDDRIRAIDERSTGFVYAVSTTGTTGGTLSAGDATDEYLARARSLVRNNALLVGFGIRTAADAVKLTRHTDGFVVGSAIVTRIDELWRASLALDDRLSELAKFVNALCVKGEAAT